jgi:hypothetical protein
MKLIFEGTNKGYERLLNTLAETDTCYPMLFGMQNEPCGSGRCCRGHLTSVIEFREVKPKRWRAEQGGEYYFVGTLGNACKQIENHGEWDETAFRLGNYFQTEARAILAEEQVRAVFAKFREQEESQ